MLYFKQWITRPIIALMALFMLLGSVNAHADEFMPVDDAFMYQATLTSPTTLQIDIDVNPAYHLYRDRLQTLVAGADGKETQYFGAIDYPHGKREFDENFGKELEILHGDVQWTVPLKAGQGAFTVEIHYQGCADKGLCYPPQTREIKLAPLASGKGYRVISGAYSPLSDVAANPAPESAPAQATPSAPVANAPASAAHAPASTSSEPPLMTAKAAPLSPDATNANRAQSTGGASSATSTASNNSQSSSVKAAEPAGASTATSSPAASTPTASTSAPAANAPTAATSAPAAAPITAKSLLSTSSSSSIASYLVQAGWFKIILMMFLLGVLLSFTPCVLPMVPILLSLLVSHAARSPESAAHSSESAARNSEAAPEAAPTTTNTTPSKASALRMTLSYVMGTAVVYTALGLAAASVGAALSLWLQNPWVLGAFALILVLLALSLFDLYTLQLPSRWQQKLHARANGVQSKGSLSAFIMGCISALIIGPCIAAPLAGILLFIGQTGNLWIGGTALFALAWGQGALLIVLGLSSGRWMPMMGAWMERVKQFFGLLLIATAWWLISPFLPSVLEMIGWAAFSVALGLLLGAFTPADRDEGFKPGQLLRQTLGWLLIGWSVVILMGASLGSSNPLQPLSGLGNAPSQSVLQDAQQARQNGVGLALGNTQINTFLHVENLADLNQIVRTSTRPVLVDVSAEWCVSCKEMEARTFPNAQVQRLMKNFTLVRLDVTKNTAESQEALKSLHLFGPPGILFFDHGKALPMDIVGFVNAEQFSQHLQKVLSSLK